MDAPDADADPITVIRDGWDLHLRYGIANPTFYSRIYGRAVPEQPCGVVSEVEAMLLPPCDRQQPREDCASRPSTPRARFSPPAPA